MDRCRDEGGDRRVGEEGIGHEEREGRKGRKLYVHQ